VVGGLTVSTLLTLFLVPTAYMILEERFPRAAKEPIDQEPGALVVQQA
jgi:hypothetical protein